MVNGLARTPIGGGELRVKKEEVCVLSFAWIATQEIPKWNNKKSFASHKHTQS